MAYLGLVPGEDSSGDKHRRGRITRTGNTLVRRLMVEAARHYQHRPGIGVALARRRTRTARGASSPSRIRRNSDYVDDFGSSPRQHKPTPKIVVAIARELVGFLWAALQPAPTPLQSPDTAPSCRTGGGRRRAAKTADGQARL